MNDVTIKAVLNGWKVEVGCQEVVFTDKKKMLDALSLYLESPKVETKNWLKNSINSGIFMEQSAARGNLILGSGSLYLIDDEERPDSEPEQTPNQEG